MKLKYFNTHSSCFSSSDVTHPGSTDQVRPGHTTECVSSLISLGVVTGLQSCPALTSSGQMMRLHTSLSVFHHILSVFFLTGQK